MDDGSGFNSMTWYEAPLTLAGGKLYFSANNGTDGLELYAVYTNVSSTGEVVEISEDQPAGTVVTQFGATDPEGGALTYSLVAGAGDANNSLFTLDPNGVLKTAYSLNHEGSQTLSIRVQAMDNGGASLEGNFSILLQGSEQLPNNPPTNLTAGVVVEAGNAEQVKDIVSGAEGSDPRSFTEFAGEAYFSVPAGNRMGLWKTDGTAAGTVMVKDLNLTRDEYGRSGELVVYNNELYFVANDGTSGRELWKTDGTESGTVLVKDIYSGTDEYSGEPYSADPVGLTVFNGELFFNATNANGTEPWKTDGTESGTVMLKDIYSGDDFGVPNSSHPQEWLVMGSYLYFSATDQNGQELWKTDGTESGTVLVKDIYTGTNDLGDVASSAPTWLTVLNNEIIFRVGDYNGAELWKTDGTESGTVLVKDIGSGTDGIGPDGSPGVLTLYNNELYFSASDDDGSGGGSGTELWKTDGTASGTIRVKDIYPGTDEYGVAASSMPILFTVFEDELFFTAMDSYGNELWKTNGTESGTVMVKDINMGGADSNPLDLQVFGGKLFFFADNGADGYELWESDGTEAGTKLHLDINPGMTSSARLVSMNDGTEWGTYSFNVAPLYVAGGKMYFSADNGTDGQELYAVDANVSSTGAGQSIEISENQPVGSVVTQFGATDPEGGALTYSLVAGAGDANNSLFTLDPNGVLKTKSLLDYESGASLSIRVQAKDENNASVEGNFTVTLLDVYEPSKGNHIAELNSTVDLEMIWVEPGTFTMGNSDDYNAKPEHEVTLTKGFYLGKYEVTQAQYEAVMTGNSEGLSATPSKFSGNPNRPVEEVSWDDVQVFLKRLNEQQADNLSKGWAYTLPTEAQWEYSCRAGSNTVFSWGDTITLDDAHYDNYGGETKDVGQYSANAWGLFDMHGNVWEWTADVLAPYSSSPKTDPFNEDNSDSLRVSRGGAYNNAEYFLPTTNRTNPAPPEPSIGFRLSLQKVPHVVELNSTVNMEMIWVEPGTFTMGSPTTEAGRQSDEVEHNVTLTNGFYLAKYELTQAQYKAVVDNNDIGLDSTPSYLPTFYPNRPVENVSWDTVQLFLTVLNNKLSNHLANGWSYVLPTEAEWEYACRAGTNTPFSWGESADTSKTNYLDNNLNRPEEVGSFAPNPWGFHDMHGNVYEWVNDVYGGPYSVNSITDPQGSLSGSNYVRRGGAFYTSFDGIRSAWRKSSTSNAVNRAYGLRLALKQVPDTVSPELELFGGTDVPHELGEPWAEPGYAASDERDGNLTSSVTISGTPNINTSGTYTITYTVADAAGNEANATRTVNVIDSGTDTDGDGFDDFLEATTGSDSADPNSTPLQQGLVAWYPFDGNASDMSGNSNHATLNGPTLAKDRYGRSEKAFYFDGVDDFISSTITSANTITFFCWVNLEDQPSQYPKLFDLGSSFPYFRMGLENGTLRSLSSVQSGNHASILSLGNHSFDNWFSLATMLGEGTDHTIFKNGAKIDSASYKRIPASDGSLIIGSNSQTGTTHFLKAAVDDVYIYNRGLSDDEIFKLHSLEVDNLLPTDLNSTAPLTITENQPVGTIV